MRPHEEAPDTQIPIVKEMIMLDDKGLSRLTPLDVRDIWKHEAHDFTTWLLANEDVLGDVLGMSLSLSAAEHKVGSFSLDLIGVDLATGATVIVENQLAQTDHSHLGQLLTYAGGTDPATIVWCAPAFREEHRAALDWLNEHTDESANFFGVEISAVRIGNSAPAPLFRLVAKPNNWTKQMHLKAASTSSPKGAAYQEFWGELLGRVRTHHPTWTSASAQTSSSWITMPYGSSSIWYSLNFTKSGPRIELYFGSPDPATNLEELHRFDEHRGRLDQAMHEAVVFDEIPGKKACRIYVDRPQGGDVSDLASREAMLDWFLTTMTAFRSVTQEIRTLHQKP